MKTYGIIGYPLAHSFSQKYFTQKFLTEGLTDCNYQVFPIQHLTKLADLLQANPQLKGLSVTIPHKKNVIALLTDATKIDASLAACNSIKISNGKLIGYNTDAIGFEKSLQPLLQVQHTNALVLGNGGAANAVKYVLRKLNIAYKIVGRNKTTDIDYLYEDLTQHIIAENTLIINTTPVGTFPDVDECPNIPYQHLTQKHLLYDLVYNPIKTFFLQKGEEQGTAIKNGYEMLLIQAEESWRIWNEE